MKRLSKQQVAQHTALAEKLTEARDELNVAIGQFNEEVARLHAELLVPKVDAANAAIAEALSFAEEIHGDQESYHEERSDNWKEGEAGQAYEDWMSSWGDVVGGLDELDLEQPTPFDEVAIDVEAFAEIETEVNS